MDFIDEDIDITPRRPTKVTPIYTKVIGNIGVHIEYFSTGSYCLYIVEMPAEFYKAEESCSGKSCEDCEDPCGRAELEAEGFEFPESGEDWLRTCIYLMETGAGEELDETPPVNMMYMTPLLFDNMEDGIAYLKDCLMDMRDASNGILEEVEKTQVMEFS